MTRIELDHLTGPEAPLADYDTRDGLTVRRNLLIGLWAAERLGLRGAEAEAYAWQVHLADLDAPGHDDIVTKIASDLDRAGGTACERTVRRQLREMEARAALDLAG
jgi:hypothetical protein